MQQSTDAQLVESLKMGNSESFGQLYRKYFPKVYHTCFSYFGNRDDAFDVTQDIVMKVYAKIDSFEGNSTFSTWLFSIAKNHCLSFISRRKNELHMDQDQEFAQLFDESGPEELEVRQRREDMENDMGKYLEILPLSDQRMLELKYRFNYSINELQREFGISASAVKMRLLRSRQKVEKVYLQLAS